MLDLAASFFLELFSEQFMLSHEWAHAWRNRNAGLPFGEAFCFTNPSFAAEQAGEAAMWDVIFTSPACGEPHSYFRSLWHVFEKSSVQFRNYF